MTPFLQLFTESRGLLGVVEFFDLPFMPKRMFWITNVPTATSRAGHAHHTCTQLLIGLSGSTIATVTTEDGVSNATTLNVGDSLLIPPRHWLVLSDFAPGSVLGVLASEPYNPDEYITDYSKFENFTST